MRIIRRFALIPTTMDNGVVVFLRKYAVKQILTHEHGKDYCRYTWVDVKKRA